LAIQADAFRGLGVAVLPPFAWRPLGPPAGIPATSLYNCGRAGTSTTFAIGLESPSAGSFEAAASSLAGAPGRATRRRTARRRGLWRDAPRAAPRAPGRASPSP